MKIIISHDIDHIKASEHYKDLIIPKFLIRNILELMLFKISLKEYFLRILSIFKNKWNNIQEIMKFNLENNIPATFFIGVSNGLGLNYDMKLAEKWTKKIIAQKFDCGVHGIEHRCQEKINNEYNIFKQLSGLQEFGIRMHYLRNNENTFKMLAQAGYIFDSTDFINKKHYFIDNMLEFPLHIMESFEIENQRRWQSRTLNEAVKNSLQKIEDANNQNIKYLTILFHDRYFDNAFYTWKNWYIQIIDYCRTNNYQFISYKEAISEIKANLFAKY